MTPLVHAIAIAMVPLLRAELVPMGWAIRLLAFVGAHSGQFLTWGI